MKSSYEVRAMKFAQVLSRLFAHCKYLDDYKAVIAEYNRTHSRPLHFAYGVSRIAIIRSDYVIKFDHIPESGWDDGRAGNCKSEEEVYARACTDGFEYLLAKTTVYTVNELTFSIMPRVNHVGDWERYWADYCTDEERAWLYENVYDLHEGNVGYKNGKVVVIDYAWDGASDEESDW